MTPAWLRSPQMRLALELGLSAAGLALLAPWLHARLAPQVWEQLVWWELGLFVLPLQILAVWRTRRLMQHALGGEVEQAWRSQLAALGVLLAGLGLTVLAVARLNDQVHEVANERFSNQVESLRRELVLRLEQPLSALQGLKALHLAHNEFKRLEFTRWVSSHDLARDYPGIRGLGFIERVKREWLDKFIERERADDAPDFKVRSSGNLPDLYVIKYIEPVNVNRQALGFDVGAEPVRRAAVESAIRSGKPTRTGPIALVQGKGQGLGFLVMLPVHDADAMLDTEERRLASTAGLVYAPVLIEQMLAEIGESTGGLLDFELHDSDARGQPQRLFALHPAAAGAGAGAAADQSVRRLELSLLVADRPLLLQIRSTPEFAAAVDVHKPFWLGLAGAAVSSSLALVVWLITTGRLRATQYANRLNEELQSKNQRFALALEGGNDGLWDWIDTHAQLMWWSPQFYRLLGWERGDLEPSIAVFDTLLHPDDQPRTLEALSAALRDEQAYDVEFRLRHRDGGYRWFRSRAKVFRNEAGEHQRMAGSLQDIDELKAVQAAVRARNDQMAAIFALSPDAFVSFDRAGLVHFVSPAFTPLTGMAPHLIESQDGTSLLELLQLQASPGGRALRLQELIEGPVSLELRQPMQRTLELRLHQAPPDSQISQVLHLRDMTHQVEVEQMKSEFLSTAAHELRTPMASIYGFTELMLTREMAPERQKAFLQKVYRQSQAMMAILNELLDLARIEARRGKDFELVSLDLAELTREAAQDYPPPAGREPPQLALGDAPALVTADRAKLAQTLRNLISNAYKYSPEGGPVEITLSREGEGERALLRLDVRDHGIGMTPDQLAHVTERFYRADTSGAIPGTGLGMSIVREIIELHGGRLELASEPGQGTVASVLLPAVRSAESAAAPAAAPAAANAA